MKKAIGRPHKVDYRVMIKLADAIQHSATIGEACRFAGISRQTYFYYLNNNSVFREKMATAKSNQDKLVMSFLTMW
ncbi:MAG: hypothetical protein JWN38_134 [Candidatus Saccharibacteria bacterium]|nr:hypothetical protein [Candidatus Saccharibacteria bacterium]